MLQRADATEGSCYTGGHATQGVMLQRGHSSLGPSYLRLKFNSTALS